MLTDWRTALTNKRFAGLALTTSGLLALYSQLYLALPLEGRRVTGSEGAVAAILVVSTVVTVACQVRVTQWCRERMAPGQAIVLGLALIGLAFAPLALLSPLQGTTETTVGLLPMAWNALPVLLASAVLGDGRIVEEVRGGPADGVAAAPALHPSARALLDLQG